MRRATWNLKNERRFLVISIHALHEESDLVIHERIHVEVISIHALHEESDPYLHAVVEGVPISIHALHEESDQQYHVLWVRVCRFQSTLSMRRATFGGE